MERISVKADIDSKEDALDMTKTKELAKKAEKKTEKVKLGMLVSRLNFPVVVRYGEEDIRVSPRQKMKIADMDLLGDLPNGVICREVKEKKE